MRPNPARCAPALAAVLVVLLTQHSTAEARRRGVHSKTHTRPAAPAQAGMTASVDPVTGALRMPTSEELLRLSPAETNSLSRSSAGLTEFHRPDGTVGINLQGRFQDFVVVHVRPDGRKVFTCVEDASGVNPRPDAENHPAAAPKMEDR